MDTAFLREMVVVLSLGVARTTALFLITPFLGRGVLTGLARNGVILSLSVLLMPALLAGRPADLDTGNVILILALVLKELLIGVLLGLPVAVVSWGLEAAGFMIDNQRGSTMASSLNPSTGNQSSPMGILLGQVYTTWLFVGGGFLAMLDLLYRSHQVWPAWAFVPALSPVFPGEMLGMLDSVMRLTLLLAGPAMIAMFLSEFGLALVSRFAPQLQVFFLAMPLKSAVGILLLLLSLGVVLDVTRTQLPAVGPLLDTVRHWFGQN